MENGDIDAVRDFINTGADVNARDDHGDTPLHRTSRDGEIEIASLLIESGADVNARTSDGFTPLFIVSFDGNVSIINILIQAGMNVNARNMFRMAAAGTVEYEPIHVVAYNGHAEAITVLADAGANVNSRASNGSWTLNLAFNFGRERREAFNALRQAGATLPCKEWDIPCHNYVPEYREWLGLPPTVMTLELNRRTG